MPGALVPLLLKKAQRTGVTRVNEDKTTNSNIVDEGTRCWKGYEKKGMKT